MTFPKRYLTSGLSKTTAPSPSQRLSRLNIPFLLSRLGWYLGYYSNAWHKSPVPRDAQGHALQVGTIATDPDVIASGRSITIPEMYHYLKRKRFIAKDVGRNIRKRRIDVYTGEGYTAKKAAYKLTRRDHRICM